MSAFTGFSLLPSNITVRNSLPARFDCQAAVGFIRWGVGDDLILNESNCLECQVLTNGSLFIPSVTQAHGGHYTCFIIGVIGAMPSYSVYLIVTG